MIVCGLKRLSLGLALCLALSVPLSSESVDPHSLPPFDASRTYQVDGQTLELFRLGLITLDDQLTEAKKQLAISLDSLKTYRQKTRLIEGGLIAACAALFYLAVK